MPPTATSFKENSNIFVFNGPLYFSISGGSFELKTSKSKKLSSFLTDTFSTLADPTETETKHKPESPDARSESPDARSESPDAKSELEDDQKQGPEGAISGVEQKLSTEGYPERRADEKGTEISSGESKAAPPIDPTVQLAEFFRTRKSPRY